MQLDTRALIELVSPNLKLNQVIVEMNTKQETIKMNSTINNLVQNEGL